MEVNAISPPPSPPMLETDGYSSCRIDITDAAMDAVTLLICLCGLVGNGAVLWLLGCRIRRNSITIYILNLAVADFTFLLFMVTSVLLYMMENIFCSSVVALVYQRPLFLLSLFSYNTSLFLLMAISIERCTSVLCCSTRRPQRLSTLVCVLLWALSIAVVAAVTSLCLLHEDHHCRVALISMYTLNFLIFAPPMVISSTILFIKVQCGSQQRQPKRLYIVIFLTVLFFLIFGAPLSVWNFLQQFGYAAVPSQAVFLLACINSSIKPCIYFLVGSCRRRCSVVPLQVAFRRVFGEPEDDIAFSSDTTMNALAPAY